MANIDSLIEVECTNALAQSTQDITNAISGGLTSNLSATISKVTFDGYVYRCIITYADTYTEASVISALQQVLSDIDGEVTITNSTLRKIQYIN